MSPNRATLMLTGVLLAAPILNLAAGPAAAQTKPPAGQEAKPPASHATSGVVKSMDATSLVISRGKDKDMTFVVNASTRHQGDLAVGASVDVRYLTEGGKNVATAITVQTKKK